ncbi:inverse autotransporter beta domain-containing protein [Salmonella enterica subsp. enterica]|nr:inverse autotransporter beta domain-containing protein [Salmonella enterica subsp. enterica]
MPPLPQVQARRRGAGTSRRRKWPGMPRWQLPASSAKATPPRPWLAICIVEAAWRFQQWLSHFGTARVQLTRTKTSPLKTRSLTLLLPLSGDRGDNFVFTRGSLHRTDSRTCAQPLAPAGVTHLHILRWQKSADLSWSSCACRRRS